MAPERSYTIFVFRLFLKTDFSSPFSSGLPPYPTVPSHCRSSQRLHPSSTASSELPPLRRVLHASRVAAWNAHVLTTIGGPPDCEALVQDEVNATIQTIKQSLCSFITVWSIKPLWEANIRKKYWTNLSLALASDSWKWEQQLSLFE